MSSAAAFALREEYEGTVTQIAEEGAEPVEVPAFTGGVIAAGDEDLNVRELLDGDEYGPPGVIVVDRSATNIVNALEQYPPLKAVTPPAGATALTEYDGATATVLKRELERRGITGTGKRDDLEAALRAHDAGHGEGLDELTVTGLLEAAAAANDEQGGQS
jgi:hypothetical protein